MGLVILVDLEVIREIHSWSHFNREAFIHPELTPEEDWEAMNDPLWFEKNLEKRYYPGPYLVRVNDENVWISRGHDGWSFVVQRLRHESVEQRQWRAYLGLLAEEIGISSSTLLNRYTGIRRRLRNRPEGWYYWDDLYTWDEGSDQVWDSLYEHPRLKTREGRWREVSYVSR